METRLNVAIQKSGRLLEDSLQLFQECGIKVDNGQDLLKVSSPNFPIDVLFLRNSDIPQYIQDGVAHVGIIGENTHIEKQKSLHKVMPLGFSKCRLSIATPKGTPYTGPSFLQGKRIATSYPNTLIQYLNKNNIKADIHEISGSVEIAPGIGLADAICDLVSSGSTLFRNGLEENEIILKSEACIYSTLHLNTQHQNILDKLVFRINSVMEARRNRYLLMNAPKSAIDAIIQILPGMKSPTITPLADPDWVSVHTVISEARFWEVIDQLKEVGAQGILIIPIEKMII